MITHIITKCIIHHFYISTLQYHLNVSDQHNSFLMPCRPLSMFAPNIIVLHKSFNIYMFQNSLPREKFIVFANTARKKELTIFSALKADYLQTS